jgi:ssDNA-binding replication factor A large subunit
MPKYHVKDLKPGMKDVNIQLKVDFLGEKRRGDGFGGDIFKIGFATDETGEVKMLFYNDDCKAAKEGQMIHIKGGYVTEWNGQIQLHPDKKKGIKFLKE